MIVSLDKLKAQVNTTLPDEVLEDKLKAIEQLVRNSTNNHFQVRTRRAECMIVGGKLYMLRPLFSVGDTVEISESKYNNGVYEVKAVEENLTTLSEDLLDEPHGLVTLVKYPADVQQGVIDLIKWDLKNRDKVGIASETISRHSVTYFSMDGDNSTLGYPKALTGFLKGYKKARF